MGPFRLMDLIGLDINYAASLSIYEAYFHEPRYRPSPWLRRRAALGVSLLTQEQERFPC